MKQQISFLLMLFSVIQISFSQESLAELLKKHNSKSVPYISAEELAMPNTQAILLAAREFQEYQVSHIKNAVFGGYHEFDLQQTTSQPTTRQQTISVSSYLGISTEEIDGKFSKPA